MGAAKGNKNAEGNKGGRRPTAFKQEYVKQVYNYCLLGSTDGELATFFEVSETTIKTWKRKHPEFAEALRKGKSLADGKAAACLFKRITGFKYDEVHFEKFSLDASVKDEPNDQIKMPGYKKKIVTKMVIPDTTAIIFWLKNRAKDKWKDRHDLNLNPEDLTDEQLQKLAEKMLKQAEAAK